MKFLVKNNHSIYKLVAVLFFLMPFTALDAQNTEIMEIISGESSIESAVINITPPNQKAQNIPVQVGYNLPSGAVIKTSGTKLKLNALGNEQVILPNSTHTIVRITPKEHAHKTTRGQSVHYVNNKSVVYKASGKKKIYAKAPSTVFSVTVDGETESFSTLEGQIATVEEIRLEVDQDSKNSVSNRNRPLTSAKTTYVNAGESKYFDGNEEVEYYSTYNEALSKIQQRLKDNRNTGYIDIEQIAHEYMLVGELLLDEGNPNNAITYFESAIDFLYQLEYRELSIAEAYLLLAEVYAMTGDINRVNEYANAAINMIKPILQFDEMEYKYALEDGDTEIMEDIAYDLFDEYDYLGWAYELMKDNNTAIRYYNKADALGVND